MVYSLKLIIFLLFSEKPVTRQADNETMADRYPCESLARGGERPPRGSCGVGTRGSSGRRTPPRRELPQELVRAHPEVVRAPLRGSTRGRGLSRRGGNGQGRRPEGNQALTPAERMRRWRQPQKDQMGEKAFKEVVYLDNKRRRVR